MKQYKYYFLHMERSMKIYIFMWSMVGFSSFGLQAVLLNLYMVQLGFNEATIGRFLAIAQICFGLAALPAGFIGARLGPRNGLMIGTSMVAIGWMLFSLAEILPANAVVNWTAVSLQVGMALANMGLATMIVNGAPYLMCITDDSNRFYYISFQQAVQALLGLVGAYTAGVLPGVLAALAGKGLDEANYYRFVLWLIPIGFLCAFVFLFRARQVQLQVPERDLTEMPAKPSQFPWKIFAIYMLIVYLAILGDFGSRTFFNLYLKNMGLDTHQIGAMFGFNQLAPFITALAIPTVLRRLGTGKTFSTGALLLGAVLMFLSFVSSLSAVSFGFFLMALMSTVMQATRSLFGQELVESRWRTFIASVGTIAMALGAASSSILGGWIIPTFGFHTLFRIGSLLVFLAGLFILVYLRLTNWFSVKPFAERTRPPLRDPIPPE